MKKINHLKLPQFTRVCLALFLCAPLFAAKLHATFSTADLQFWGNSSSSSMQGTAQLGFNSLDAFVAGYRKLQGDFQQEQKTKQGLATQVSSLNQKNRTLTNQLQTEQQTSRKLSQASQGHTSQIAALQGQSTTLQNQLAAARQQITQTQKHTLPDQFQGSTDQVEELLRAIYQDVYERCLEDGTTIEISDLFRDFIASR